MIKNKCWKFNNRKEVKNCWKSSKGKGHKSARGYLANERVLIGTKIQKQEERLLQAGEARGTW